MKKMFAIEFRRLLKSPSFYIAIAIGVFLAISTVIMYAIPYAEANDTGFFNTYNSIPHSVFTTMMGINGFEWQSSAFFNLAPLLATIPYGYSFYRDKKTGYIKNLYSRSKKRNYIFSKYIVTFFSGGLVLSLPWIINLLGTMMVVPYIKPIAGSHMFDMEGGEYIWSELYYSHPIMYVFVFAIQCFIFGGLLACMCLSAVYIVNGIFMVQLFPYIFITVYNMAVPAISTKRITLLTSPMIFSLKEPIGIKIWNIVLTISVFFIFSIVYFWRGLKEDCL